MRLTTKIWLAFEVSKIAMRKLRIAVLLTTALFGETLGHVEAGIIVDSVNQSSSPVSGHYNTATDVGWFYSPATSFVLNQIDTKFSPDFIDGRAVSVEIFDGFPTAGGPLRSASFTPTGGVFEGGTFSPLALSAGHSYFVGFENVSGFSLNVTSDAGAESLGSIYFDTDHSNLFNGGNDQSDSFTSQPILEFLGPEAAAVPAPSTLTMLSLVLGMFAIVWTLNRVNFNRAVHRD